MEVGFKYWSRLWRLTDSSLRRRQPTFPTAGSQEWLLRWASLPVTLVRFQPTPLPWERNLWSELFALKADATLLYLIRAQSRHRLHLVKVIRRHAPLGLPPMERFTLEDQARLIGDRWKTYELIGEAA